MDTCLRATSPPTSAQNATRANRGYYRRVSRLVPVQSRSPTPAVQPIRTATTDPHGESGFAGVETFDSLSASSLSANIVVRPMVAPIGCMVGLLPTIGMYRQGLSYTDAQVSMSKDWGDQHFEATAGRGLPMSVRTELRQERESTPCQLSAGVWGCTMMRSNKFSGCVS